MTHTDIAGMIQVLRDLIEDGFTAAALAGMETLQRDVEALATHPAPAASVSDERPVSNPDELPKGFVPLQRENGELVYAACLDGGRYHGWLMWKHPDGQWVTKRKMTSLEVMQAEDQAHYGIVQEARKENP